MPCSWAMARPRGHASVLTAASDPVSGGAAGERPLAPSRASTAALGCPYGPGAAGSGQARYSASAVCRAKADCVAVWRPVLDPVWIQGLGRCGHWPASGPDPAGRAVAARGWASTTSKAFCTDWWMARPSRNRTSVLAGCTFTSTNSGAISRNRTQAAWRWPCSTSS